MDTEEKGYEDVCCIQKAQDLGLISSVSGELVMNLQDALMVHNFFAE
jgi:hypothetical protein